MKKLRILALMHEDLVPPDDLTGSTEEQINEWKTEFDVCSALADMGHDVYKLGARDELRPIRQALEAWKPDIVFNLLEEFKGEAVYDQNVVAFLELAGMAYTGCNPRGLMLARDKAVSKQLTTYHRIRAPRFAVYPIGRKVHKPKRLVYPLIVKSLMEDSSMGISQASVVNDILDLKDVRAHFVVGVPRFELGKALAPTALAEVPRSLSSYFAPASPQGGAGGWIRREQMKKQFRPAECSERPHQRT